jgi:hypothetical protein
MCAGKNSNNLEEERRHPRFSPVFCKRTPNWSGASAKADTLPNGKNLLEKLFWKYTGLFTGMELEAVS